MKPSVEIVRNHRKPKNVDSGEVDRRTLELRVTYRRIPRYFAADGTLKLTLEEFNNNKLKCHKVAFEEVRPAYNAAIEVVKKLGDNFTFDKFSKEYKRIIHHDYLSAYDIENIFQEYLSNTSRTRPISEKSKTLYTTVQNWLIKFKKGLVIADITPDFVAKLEAYFHKCNPNMSLNTTNIYLRIIRAVYNYAVEKGYVTDQHPFKKRSLASSRKVNYGLTKQSYHMILKYSSQDPIAQFGRDFFVLSFECNGNYLSDILRLKNRNILQTEEGWVLQFVRHKTKKFATPVSLYVTDLAKQIMEKYGRVNLLQPEDYIFPFLSAGKTERQENNIIHDVTSRANLGMTMVTSELGLLHVTMAQARHTYASLMIESGSLLTDLQSDMGHTTNVTTQGYINSLRVASMKKGKELKEELHKNSSSPAQS